MTQRLDPASWLHFAEALEVGESMRTAHDCGDGACLLVEHKPAGFSAWCHRCGLPGWVPHKRLSVAERLAILDAQKAVERSMERTLTLPSPANFNVSEWPLRFRVWLYKGGLLNTDIEDLGLYWHEESDRLVIPVFCDGSLVYWQARSETQGRPKYLNPKVNRERIVGWFPWQEPASGRVILTEDYLSAFRIHKATGEQTCALFGLRISDYVMAKLLKCSEVVVWLDPDWGVQGCPGQRAAEAILSGLDLFGMPASNIVSRADPKKLSSEEIRDALESQGRRHSYP